MTLNNTAGAAETAPVQTDDTAVPFPLEEGDTTLVGDRDAASEEDSQPSATEDTVDADATADEASDSEDAPAEDGDETEARKRNKVPAPQRIKQLSDRAKAAERRAIDAETRAARLDHQLAQIEQRQRPGEAADYDSDAAYAQAIVQDAVAAAKEDALKTARQEAIEEREVARRDAWLEKSSDMREKTPDFDAVVTNPTTPISPYMRDAITAEDTGPAIAYWLGKNPQEAAKIARLSPLQQATEIGKLAVRFEQAPVAKKVTKAPPVTKKLDGHGSPATVNPAKMTTEEYRTWRANVNAEKARARAPR